MAAVAWPYIELRTDKDKENQFSFIWTYPDLYVLCRGSGKYLFTDLWSRVLLEKLTGFQLVKKFPAFFVSLPQSQVPATYPEPARSSPYPHIPLSEDPS